jgi:DNA end-binding protein Ku
MPRSIWTGTITVGLLSIPVKLFTAVKRKGIAFNQIDDQTQSRVRYQKVAEATGEIVPNEHIVKGFDLGSDRFVVITDDDLAPISPAKSKEIAVNAFVPADQIPMVSFDASYIVMPGKTVKPYALLAKALGDTGRVAIGKFVMRQKESLAIIRSDGRQLTLTTLVFPDEVVDPATVEDLDLVAQVAITDRELTMANTLIEALSDPFDPEQFQDSYRGEVMRLIQAKAEGQTFVVEDAPQHAEVIDLASALEASVDAAKAARSRHPSARQSSAEAKSRKQRSA